MTNAFPVDNDSFIASSSFSFDLHNYDTLLDTGRRGHRCDKQGKQNQSMQ